MCVEECPDNFYVDASYKCQYCGDNNEYCELPPLTYTMETYERNYKLYMKIVFNRAVNMTVGEFIQYLRLNTQTRSIKPSEFLARKSTGTTFVLEFLNSASLN